VLCPSSEAEFRPRVAGPTVWWAVGATEAVSYLKRALGLFAFCFLRKKVGFPWLFRGPLWLSPALSHTFGRRWWRGWWTTACAAKPKGERQRRLHRVLSWRSASWMKPPTPRSRSPLRRRQN
jgi:hypothetical protein